MDFIIKDFASLTVNELFEIYKLRQSVFIVEQNCPYNDIDNVDKKSIHLLMIEENNLIGYLRIVPKGEKFKEVSIGRVISAKRGRGNGFILLNKGIEVAKNIYKPKEIVLEAQEYAKAFYEKANFVQCSNMFLEDNIPHIMMKLKVSD